MALKHPRGLSFVLASESATFGHYVAPGKSVFRGSIVALCNDGTIVKAGDASPPAPILCLLGVADSSGAGFDANAPQGQNDVVDVKRGIVKLLFDKPPSWENYGQPVFAVDDEIVTLNKATKKSDGSAGADLLQIGTLAGFDLDGTPFVKILEGLA